ncbi:2-polyprenyl-6-methoxyphenol hydroxylase [Haladaptatus litoreus]|uniref:2-polyprenyl-6-methoxyphenol hydroxylase n=1 Tax=Haladaptatus litoreus TaxID=553468 RepID=A0A1N6VWX1_9EURY|nr:NAD(P)/FAD-dependent oxidoreductase [Haladaptatus litoreus]SIQ82377.1 2-polyprenyl-6-methoxyphenol hydroxylase [Haladaptatus litoreus]
MKERINGSDEPATKRKALIIGCGVAGPVLAMYLQRTGITPVIYEGQPEPRDDAGFFLNLAANGTDVLDTLGIGDEVLEHGHRTKNLVFQNHRQKQLGENPQETVLIKRGRLTEGLREAALDRGIEVNFGKRLTDVQIPHDEMAIAYFDDGTEAHGDFLVGCDGIHSQTRRSILPNTPEPEYTGIIDSGAFARTESIPPSDGVMRMTFGVDGFFGYQKVPTGEIYWFENHERATAPERTELDAISTPEWKEKLLRRHRDDHDEITEIIRSTEGEIGKWPVYDLPSLPTWYRESVCLIGDAAHATSPHVGQGASLAMEDAIVLAKCVRDSEHVSDAFETFETLRRERVKDIVKKSRETGNQKAPSNVVTRKMRDIVLPFFLKRGMKNFEQIYSYRVNWNESV